MNYDGKLISRICEINCNFVKVMFYLGVTVVYQLVVHNI